MTETGPPYPPSPKAGSNAIGSFEIGVSPIGTIPSFNWWMTVLSQYANSQILTQLLFNFDQCIDQTVNLDAFYDFIWNVDTAQGYGLDVWGRIVNVSRTLQVNSVDYLGFEEAADPTETPFGFGTFYAGASVTDNYELSDSSYRVLIFAKALANISDGSIKSINQLLLNLFPGRGNCFVTDGGDTGEYFAFSESGYAQPFGQSSFYGGGSIAVDNMTMTYTFMFQPTSVELAIIEQSGVLPKPVGVSASVVIDL